MATRLVCLISLVLLSGSANASRQHKVPSCSSIVLSNASNPLEEMGLPYFSQYEWKAGDFHSGRPLFKSVSSPYVLFYLSSRSMWCVGTDIGSSNVALFVQSDASEPAHIEELWMRFQGGRFLPSAVRAECSDWLHNVQNRSSSPPGLIRFADGSDNSMKPHVRQMYMNLALDGNNVPIMTRLAIALRVDEKRAEDSEKMFERAIAVKERATKTLCNATPREAIVAGVAGDSSEIDDWAINPTIEHAQHILLPQRRIAEAHAAYERVLTNAMHKRECNSIHGNPDRAVQEATLYSIVLLQEVLLSTSAARRVAHVASRAVSLGALDLDVDEAIVGNEDVQETKRGKALFLWLFGRPVSSHAEFPSKDDKALHLKKAFYGLGSQQNWLALIDGRDHARGRNAYNRCPTKMHADETFYTGAGECLWIEKMEFAYDWMANDTISRAPDYSALTANDIISLHALAALGPLPLVQSYAQRLGVPVGSFCTADHDNCMMRQLTTEHAATGKGTKAHAKALGKLLDAVPNVGQPALLAVDALEKLEDVVSRYHRCFTMEAHAPLAKQCTFDTSSLPVDVGQSLSGVLERALSDPRILCVGEMIYAVRNSHPFADANARVQTLLLHRELTLLGYHPVSLLHQLVQWKDPCHVRREILRGLAAWAFARKNGKSAWGNGESKWPTWHVF